MSTTSLQSSTSSSASSTLETEFPTVPTIFTLRRLLAMSYHAVQEPQFPSYLIPTLGLSRKRKETKEVKKEAEVEDSPIEDSDIFSSPSSSLSPSDTAYTTPSSSPPNASPTKPSFFTNTPKAKATKYTPSHSVPDILRCSKCSTHFAYSTQIISKGFTGRHGRAYLVAPLPTSVPCSSRELSSIPPYHPAPLAPAPVYRAPTSLLRYFSRSSKGERDRSKEGSLENIAVGIPVQRQLVTGMHTVADISCTVCLNVVGWKYVDAREPGQRYKIGKYILETAMCVRGSGWGEVLPSSSSSSSDDEDDEVVDGEEVDEERLARARNWKQTFEGREEEPGIFAEMEGFTAKQLRERQLAMERAGVVEFDSEDESEEEDIFEGVWDENVVRKRRARKWDRELSRARRGVVRRGTAP